MMGLALDGDSWRITYATARELLSHGIKSLLATMRACYVIKRIYFKIGGSQNEAISNLKSTRPF